MLIMLDGVQGVGKSTLLNELSKHIKFKLLKRSPELNDLLKKAPRDFALVGEHLPLIRNIFFQWKNVLDSIPTDETHNIWVLDRGPITTLAYQSMTLDYVTRSPTNFEHYLKMCDIRGSKYKKPPERYKRMDQIDTVFGRSQTYIHEFMNHAFKFSAINRHSKVLALHVKADPETISTRFTDRRNDIRADNMQDWFATKADEIDNYDRSYRLVNKWLAGEPKFTSLEYSNNGDVDTGVRDIIALLNANY